MPAPVPMALLVYVIKIYIQERRERKALAVGDRLAAMAALIA